MSVDAPVPTAYTPAAKVLHWLVFALLFIQYVVAWTMPHIGRNTKPDALINLHFSFGMLILLVVLLRFAWRITSGEPTPLDDVPWWQETSARILHWVLYTLLVVSPVLGWVNASYRGFDVSLFGLAVPRLVAARTPGFAWTGDVHAVISNYLLLPLIGLHVAAALYHWLIRRDRVLQRMLPSRP